MARAIFVGGTGSNCGKSWMATALCALLARRGVRVAPFKAQNMSNNSYPCAGGGEIGRAQVEQARACGLEPSPLMNPVLLKPCGDSRSQVVLHGQVWQTVDARDYYAQAALLRKEALRAYKALASAYDVIVIEGAGSVAELNLRGRDFTNLSLAQEVGAKTLLVADIERGGVFASILGTLDLLPAEHRSLVRCFAVNRFRGDPSLFADGVAILEERSAIPCLGVFPFDEHLHLSAEDSLASPAAAHGAQHPGVAILRFPRISNTTDFRHFPNGAWLDRPPARDYPFVILPGTKSTLADLEWMRETGLAAWVLDQHSKGATVIGICGGFQMLGESVADPDGVDGTPGRAPGLALLPVGTWMEAEKTTRARRARTPGGTRFDAYEIHLGRTVASTPIEPFALLEDGRPEGASLDRVKGTYLHGALESAEVVSELFGFTPQDAGPGYAAFGRWLDRHADASVLAGLTG